MAVQKFRSYEQAREALWAAPYDTVRRLRNLLTANKRLALNAQPVPRGVTKFRDIEAAGAARDSAR